MKLDAIQKCCSFSDDDFHLSFLHQAGDTADLICSYYLDSHNLYSVKWYKVKSHVIMISCDCTITTFIGQYSKLMFMICFKGTLFCVANVNAMSRRSISL